MRYLQQITIFILLVTMLAPLSFMSSFSASAHQGSSGIVKERMDRFTRTKQDLRTSFRDGRNGDFDAVINKARFMAEWGRLMPEYFPSGSGHPPSEASPAIWQDFDDFARHGLQMTKAADEVILAAENSDTDSVITALKAVGQTCNACHRQFRQQ